MRRITQKYTKAFLHGGVATAFGHGPRAPAIGGIAQEIKIGSNIETPR